MIGRNHRSTRHSKRRGRTWRHHGPKQRVFLEGADTYRSEYRRLVKEPPIGIPVVVREISGETFRASTSQEKLALTGFAAYSLIEYDVEYDNRPADSYNVGTACTIAGISDAGEIRPFIFIDEDVQTTAGQEDDLAYAIKALMLLHEYGHANDILEGRNYHHDTRKLDIIEAEIYAHTFVLEQCRQRGYRQALKYYLQNIEEQETAPKEYRRVVSKEFRARNNMDEIAAWINENYLSDPSSPYYKEAFRRAMKGKLS